VLIWDRFLSFGFLGIERSIVFASVDSWSFCALRWGGKSKWKERREVIICIVSYTAFTGEGGEGGEMDGYTPLFDSVEFRGGEKVGCTMEER